VEGKLYNSTRIISFLDENLILIKIIWSFILILAIIILFGIVKNIIHKKVDDSQKYYVYKRRLNYTQGGLIFVLLLFLWIDSAYSFSTYVGLLSAGIAIALKEVFTNLAGWLFIESRKPFDVGHRISIGSQKGDVIDKRMFQFTLMEVSAFEEGEQSTGRIIDIPNGFIFTNPLINYTKGFGYIWNEIKVLLTFESDWKKAKQLLLEIVNNDTEVTSEVISQRIRKASKKYMIHYTKLTPIIYTDVKESGVQLTLRYLCEPKQRRTSTNKIWEDILTMLEENEDINLAYPTRRVLNL
jgi:small-conductance mechanosensitive channel